MIANPIPVIPSNNQPKFLDSGVSPVAGRLPLVMRTVALAERCTPRPSVRVATLVTSCGVCADGFTCAVMVMVTVCPGVSVPMANVTIFPAIV